MSNVGDVTTQNQLDSLSSFVRIRLRSTDHQRITNAFTSSTSAMEDRCADDWTEKNVVVKPRQRSMITPVSNGLPTVQPRASTDIVM